MTGPCGSWRVIAIVEGHEAEKRWCPRVAGPCPFPGTPESQEAEQAMEGRHCAAPLIPATDFYGPTEGEQ